MIKMGAEAFLGRPLTNPLPPTIDLITAADPPVLKPEV
jgi:hypothetical protein